MTHFVLLHSRALGPGSYGPLRSTLVARGHDVDLPIIDPSAAWHQLPDLLLDATVPAQDLVVVAHSGAGLLAPAVARGLGAPSIVFLDAQLPPAHGTVSPAEPEFIAFLTTIADKDGVLPTWATWWGDDILPTLLPDPTVCGIVHADMPRLPLSWFDDLVDVPTGWHDLDCRYVRLSATYEREATAAASLGMRTTRLTGTHLEHVIHPAVVADALLSN